MWFDGIIGQRYAVQLFRRAIQNQRLAHSYLFYGPEGIGKRSFAINLSQALQCDQGMGVGCGICPSCLKVQHNSHADLVFIEPQDKKTTISIDQIRELTPLMFQKPQEGRKRIVIIDSIDDMEVAALNALLKILEEPPQDNILILLTQQVQQVMPTILSRCQLVRFAPLSVQEMEQVLKRLYKDQPIPQAIFALSKGSIAEAKKYLEDQTLQEKWSDMADWFFQEASWNEMERTDWMGQREKANWSREEYLFFWQTWQGFLRDRLVVATNGERELLLYPHLFERYQQMEFQGATQIAERLYEIDQAIRRLGNRGNGPMITEAILMNWRRDKDADGSRRTL